MAVDTTTTVLLTATVAAVQERMETLGRRAMIVTEGDTPVGVVTLRALRGRPGHAPRPDATVADVMDFEVVEIDPGADMAATMKAYTRAAWDSLGRRRPLSPESCSRRAAAFDPQSPGP